MPRKPEPSFSLKLIIWDIAATTGTDNFSAIYRELDQRLEESRREGKLFEDTPDQRKVHDIIELDIQRLSPEVVVAKLPRHVWHLRHDYEDIKLLAEENIQAEQKAQKEAQTKQKPYEETDHKKKMRELAKELIGEISLPWIMGSFIAELKPGQLVYADPRGHRQGPPIVIAENGEISVELSLEGRGEIGHLHKGLRSHLETGGFSGVLDKIRDWRKGGGQYLKQCHDLLAVVMGEIQGGKAKIPNDDVELNKKAGFKLSFPVTICGDAVATASGHPLGFLYEPEALTNSLWLLRYGAFGIYLAQTKKELERYQRMHKKLMAKYASEPAAKDIAELRQKLYNIRDQIYRQLQVFEDMECVPGHCELCPH